jgi:PST family polysaccharide transporter
LTSKSILSNFFNLGLFQAANFLLPILAIPLIVSRIGTSNYGSVIYIQSILTFLSIIIDYGFNTTEVKEISLNKDIKLLSERFFCVFFIKILFGILLAGILLTITPIFFNKYSLILKSGIIFLVSYSFQPLFFLLAKQDTKFLAYTNILNKFVFLLIIYLVLSKNDGFLILFFQGFLNLITNLILIIYIIFKYKLSYCKPRFKIIINLLKSNSFVFFSNLATSAIIYSNIIILEMFVSPRLLGLYGIAEKIVNALRQIIYTFYQITFPLACKAIYSIKDSLQLKKLYSRLIPIIILFFMILILISKMVIAFFVHVEADLEITSIYFRLLLLLPIFVIIGVPFTQKILAHSKERIFMFIYVIVSCLNIVINLILAKNFGVMGTICAFILTEFSLLILFYQFSEKLKWK